MTLAEFQLHDTSDFPVVRLSGHGLPAGYGPQWAVEMDALLDQEQPFVLIFLDTVEDEAHEDQKLRTVWLKKNKKALAATCRGMVNIEPNKATRMVKRAQGAALAVAFGLTLKFAADRAEAESLARRLLAGEDPPDADEE
jgi:hypothetical protein